MFGPPPPDTAQPATKLPHETLKRFRRDLKFEQKWMDRVFILRPSKVEPDLTLLFDSITGMYTLGIFTPFVDLILEGIGEPNAIKEG